ncbi:MAG: YvcK family protein [Elusimicrobia bacterium]|nr:YvcK family protein [Elusimicrobiota bacterium]
MVFKKQSSSGFKKEIKSVVAIGGGTGLSTLLRGLKEHAYDITAIVNVADDGGSSGRLRNELGILPPGDVRNCLVALSEEESIMSRLFQYRFPARGSLDGHSFGNLFLTAMSAISGGFDKAVLNCAEVLAIRGRVLPVTLSDVHIEATLKNGKKVFGESNFPYIKGEIDKINLTPAGVPATPEVINAIERADLILFGPGSLYTSIIVNLLVSGITSAIERSKALKVYICNVMTQAGETSGYKLSDHINALEKHSYRNIADLVVVNSKPMPQKILKRYRLNGSVPVKIDKTHAKTVKADLFSNEIYARHDSKKLIKLILKIYKDRKKWLKF